MYDNQYLITREPVTAPDTCTTTRFGAFDVLTHHRLPVTAARDRDVEVLALGTLVDPDRPELDNAAIVSRLATTGRDPAGHRMSVRRLSGRFVILRSSRESCEAMADASALRQLFYCHRDGETDLTSSPRMYRDLVGGAVAPTSDVASFLGSPSHAATESAWFGDGSVDPRLHKLLPNHVLDLADGRVDRVPLPPASGENPTTTAGRLLSGTLEAIANRGQAVMPLTAGWDSRILLAAARPIADKVRFYVFAFDGMPADHPDLVVPRRLADALDLDFEVIRPDPLRTDFVERFRREHIDARMLPKTAAIQALYDLHHGTGHIHVTGNAGEIVRNFYGRLRVPLPRPLLLRTLVAAAGYPRHDRYIRSELERWLVDALPYAAEQGVPILDLFYWEQRMGNWAAQGAFELDLAMEELAPLSSATLVAEALTVDVGARLPPDYDWCRDLVRGLWPEALGEPVNPGTAMKRTVVARAKRSGVLNAALQRARIIRSVRGSGSRVASDRSTTPGPMRDEPGGNLT
ncbi:MAG: hypothetical protein OEU32_02245 [Acidimicrobiia bacterium]|nr:hypothetical protein [Acidimicrobiia bacterium]